MRLTATAVQNAKPDPLRPRKMYDGNGLYLLISPKNHKGWRFKYRFNKMEKGMSFGVYPHISLKDAREQREKARELLAKGIDPSQQRKIDKLQRAESNQNTFEAVAEKWFNFEKDDWSEKHKKKVSHILNKHLRHGISKIPIRQITSNMLLKTLRNIVDDKTGKNQYTATQAKQIAGQVWRYAVMEGIAKGDITPALKGRLKTPKTTHRPAIIDPLEVGKLMLDIDGYKGEHIVCYALRFLPLTFVRPGELRHAEWREINWEKTTWTIPKTKMKNKKKDHIVPLSRQAMEILYAVHEYTGNRKHIFTGIRNPEKPMSDGTINKALKKLGYKGKMVGHGFRSSASTLLNEELRAEGHFIEHQLAHALKHPLGETYNRATFLPNREEMMQNWADYLDELKARVAANME